MQKTLTVFLWMAFNSVFAQKTAIYINPMAIFSPHHVAVDIGVAKEFRNGFCSDFGLGIITKNDSWHDKPIGRREGKGFLLHFEPKLFLATKNFNSNAEVDYLIGLKTSVFQHNYKSSRFADATNKLVRTYGVNTKGFMLNATFDCRLWADNIVFMCFTVGAGVRYINVQNDSPIPISQMSAERRINSIIEPEENGNYLRFIIVSNFKVGFAF